MVIEEKLTLVRFIHDDRPHIQVDQTTCLNCEHRACTWCCPAKCYTLQGAVVIFSYEGCLECGTCEIICDRGAVRWAYPRGGFGVVYCHS